MLGDSFMRWCLPCLLSLLVVVPLSAQAQQPAQSQPAQSQEPAQPQEPAQSLQPREVTLQQAIDLALKNNLDIEIEKYNPEIVKEQQTFERSFFEPALGSLFNYRDATFPTGSTLQGASITQKTVDYNFTWAQRLYTSTSYAISFDNNRLDTSQLFTNVNPQYNTSIFATITQPLMRNFGMEITKTPLKIAEQNEITSNEQLKVKIMDIALQVEQSYWDLVYFRDQLKVTQQSLARAKELYENNKKQVEVGTMAPLEVVAAQADVATREEGIITAERLIRNTEDLLKTLVLGREVARSWPIEVIPTEEADLKSLEFSEEDAIKRGMSDNPDLKVLESDLVTKQLNIRMASNELKPQLDFKGQFGWSGLGGTTLLTDNNFPPNIIGTIPGGYGDALSNLGNNPTWAVGLVLGLPIGNQAAKADYVRADLTHKQAETFLENAKQNLIMNIRISMRNMENDIKSYDAAKASRVLQEKKLDAERKKLEVGLSTNYIVLQYQDDLAQAQSRELLYITDYSKNRAQLKRYLGLTEYLKSN